VKDLVATVVRAAVLGLSCAACSALAGPPAGAPEQPQSVDRAGPAVLVAEGTSAAGEYRAWVYRTTTNGICLEVGTKGGAGTGCSSELDTSVGVGVSVQDGAIFVEGSTSKQTAVNVIVHSAMAGDVTVPAVEAAPVIGGSRFFVAPLPAGSQPTSVDVVDGSGAVLETLVLPTFVTP
jgi:hypothetical protein